jgi:hypothetical protein
MQILQAFLLRFVSLFWLFALQTQSNIDFSIRVPNWHLFLKLKNMIKI